MNTHQPGRLSATEHDRLVDALVRHYRAGRRGEELRRAILAELPAEPSDAALSLAIDEAVDRTATSPERD